MPTSIRRPLTALALVSFAALGFAAAPPAVSPSTHPIHPTRVAEAFVSPDSPGDELDSPTTWRHPDGTLWVLVTGKSSHKVIVFDGHTGARLREVGGKGTALGQFKRPNGVAVFGDRLFVVERDNHRVQVLSLPDLKPLGSFGEGQMRSPYGLWLDPVDADTVEAYVTDNFMLGERFDVVPPLDQLNQRVRRYRVHFDAAGAVAASPEGAFGDTTEQNALKIVESIAGDPANDRLLIADEYTPQSTLHEYTMTGRATGKRIPDDTFSFEAEGVSLWSCPRNRGYWIAVDQMSPQTVFHVFDRRSLRRVGSFVGDTVSATDGIALRVERDARFPAGVLYAVHADKAIGAFDLRDVVKTLKLDRRCL